MTKPTSKNLRSRPLWILILLPLLLLFHAAPARGQQGAKAAISDPVLQAMRKELDRSKSQLKMENVPAPYYIEYRVSDLDQYDAEAVFGALRQEQRVHSRVVRVVVRVGDYKQDSYYGPGIGVTTLEPIDNDPIALRWQLWAATDSAYKAASEALAQKKATLRQYTSDQPFDDFAHAPVVESIGAITQLDFDPQPWKAMLETSTDAFRAGPKSESLSAAVHFRAVNQYLVNSEGTVTRYGYTVYLLNASGSTQAADGMRLTRGPYYTSGNIRELPTAEQ